MSNPSGPIEKNHQSLFKLHCLKNESPKCLMNMEKIYNRKMYILTLTLLNIYNITFLFLNHQLNDTLHLIIIVSYNNNLYSRTLGT